MYDFGTAIRFNDKQPQYYANRGNCMLIFNQINDALAEFQKAISVQPNDEINYLNRGLVHARLINFNNAIQDFTQGIKYIQIGQTHFKALIHRGNCYRQIKQYAKSISDLSKACQIVKDEALAQNNICQSYLENQHYDLALQRFKKAIQLDRNKATYYNNKAPVLYHGQQYDQSLVEYNKALNLDPNNARNYLIGQYLLSSSKDLKAHRDFDLAIKIMPTNAKFYH